MQLWPCEHDSKMVDELTTLDDVHIISQQLYNRQGKMITRTKVQEGYIGNQAKNRQILVGLVNH